MLLKNLVFIDLYSYLPIVVGWYIIEDKVRFEAVANSCLCIKFLLISFIRLPLLLNVVVIVPFSRLAYNYKLALWS